MIEKEILFESKRFYLCLTKHTACLMNILGLIYFDTFYYILCEIQKEKEIK